MAPAAVVDVRSREEYSSAHIPGSVNIPLDELSFRLDDLPNTEVHVLCGSGKRSRQAALILSELGYASVNVAGGITEWYRAGHPVTFAPPPESPSRQGPRRPGAYLADLFRRRPAGTS